MKNLLKLSEHNEKKEIDFELNYLKSLTVKQRFEVTIKSFSENHIQTEK